LKGKDKNRREFYLIKDRETREFIVELVCFELFSERFTGWFRGGVDMENFLEFVRSRAVVRVGRHDFFHIFPPLFADSCLRNGRPAFFIFDLCIAKELAGFRV
jgi:hypothetical protein